MKLPYSAASMQPVLPMAFLRQIEVFPSFVAWCLSTGTGRAELWAFYMQTELHCGAFFLRCCDICWIISMQKNDVSWKNQQKRRCNFHFQFTLHVFCVYSWSLLIVLSIGQDFYIFAQGKCVALPRKVKDEMDLIQSGNVEDIQWNQKGSISLGIETPKKYFCKRHKEKTRWNNNKIKELLSNTVYYDCLF